MRLDKWLWCARFYKTRSLAVAEIGKGRVTVNASHAKPSREVRAGDTLVLRQDLVVRTIVIRALSGMRGAAPVAQALYEETEQSVLERAQQAEARRLAPEPAASIAQLRDGRPTKRDRRDMERLRQAPPDWDARWSASIAPKRPK